VPVSISSLQLNMGAGQGHIGVDSGAGQLCAILDKHLSHLSNACIASKLHCYLFIYLFIYTSLLLILNR
jgi:hypothetical protein